MHEFPGTEGRTHIFKYNSHKPGKNKESSHTQIQAQTLKQMKEGWMNLLNILEHHVHAKPPLPALLHGWKYKKQQKGKVRGIIRHEHPLIYRQRKCLDNQELDTPK